MVATLCILCSLSFAMTNVTARRALVKIMDAGIGTIVSVPIGVPFFFIILLFMGQVGTLGGFTWQSYLYLAAAGIIHFSIGRSLNYHSIRAAGANVAQIIVGISPIVAAGLGILVLGEDFSWKLGAGVVLITGGVIAAGFNPQAFRNQTKGKGIPRLALLCGTAAGIAWGISPILIKLGLKGTSAPVAGAFICYAAASMILGFNLFRSDKRASLFGMERSNLGLFGIAGLLGNTAQLLRFLALNIAPASVVTPLTSIAPVFQLFFAYLINRKLENFGINVIMGTVAIVLGAVLVV